MRRSILLACAFSAHLAAADGDWITALGGSVERDSAGGIVAVNLRGTWVTDSDLLELAQMPELRRLDLSLTRVTDHGLQGLKPAPNIADLNLYYAELITDEGVAAVKSWKRLRRLNLRGTKITDTTLAHLAGIPSLESLDVGFAQITVSGLELLGNLTSLKELTIGGNKLTDNGLQFLKQVPNLTYLDLSGSQRTDSGLWFVSLTEPGTEAIATLKHLKELRLAGTQVSTRSLQKLATLDKLERLSLQRTKRIGDDAIPQLSSWKSLRQVDLKESAGTKEGIASLRTAKPDCKILWE